MKLWHDRWVPDYETKLGDPFPYQHEKFLKATALQLKRRSLALDVGAHVGLWTEQLLERFHQVIAFEPDPEKHECFTLNIDSPRAILMRVALGNKHRRVSLNQKPGTSLKTHVNLKATGEVTMHRLDDLGIVGVDFLKIDVEGYDFFVVDGAEETIRRDLPVIIVEQKPGVATKRYGIKDTAAVELLKDWGYEVEMELRGDYIMRHKGGEHV